MLEFKDFLEHPIGGGIQGDYSYTYYSDTSRKSPNSYRMSAKYIDDMKFRDLGEGFYLSEVYSFDGKEKFVAVKTLIRNN